MIRNQPDFLAGLMFVMFGLVFALGALRYPLGAAARMGPAYFPILLGVCLALLGGLLVWQSCRARTPRRPVTRPDWRAAAIVLGAVSLFALVLPSLGVLSAVFVLVFVGSMAAHDFDWRVAVLVGVGMMAFVWLVFIVGLGLVFPNGLLI